MALAHFQETIGRVLEDGDVFIGSGASVEVRDETNGALAAIFVDRDGVTPKSNPFNADSQGFADFYVASGRYRVKVSINGDVTLDLRDLEMVGPLESLPITTSTGTQTLEEALDDRVGLTVEEEAGSAYTPVLADANIKLKRLTDASAVTLAIPSDASVAFDIGTILSFEQGGVGQVDIQPESGVTLNAVDNLILKSSGQYALFQGIKISADNWVFYGSLESSQVGYLLGTKQIFDTAGEFTWTKPAGVAAVLVEVIGGGGGGRGPSASASGAGGGAGGYSRVFIDSSIGPTETVTVGAGGNGGGAGGTNGSPGTSSSFGIHCAADGGEGGSNNGGAGGLGTTGDVLARGGPGQARSYDGATHLAGNGGDSFLSGGGLSPTGATAGQAGDIGSGGSGGRDNAAGGDGGDGIVIVWEYY